MNTVELTHRLATIDEIYQLRFAVLRPKQTPMKLHFPGDDAAPPLTWHFGTFTPDRQNLACLTLFASIWEGEPALQLRGMAVADPCRSTGIGTKLLQTAYAAIAAHPEAKSWTWWCNARVPAVRFYERNGWSVVGDEFMIESVGPHKKMVRAK